jgi:hypothetical protein
LDEIEAEDIPCDFCTELAGEESDYKGDLCSDTPPTVENYDCEDPEDGDCNGDDYGDTDYRF